MRLQPRPLRLLAVALVLGVPLACNVFASLEECDADEDCSPGAVCDRVGRYCLQQAREAGGDDAPVDDAPVDVDAGTPLDASDADVELPPPCDRSKPFEAPGLVGGFEALEILSARLTPSERTALLSLKSGGPEESRTDIFFATRDGLDASFVVSTSPVPVVNTPTTPEYWPTLSADGKLLFFESNRTIPKPDGGYMLDISRVWSASRVNTTSDFEEPRIQNLFAVDASVGEGAPYLHPSGRSLYFFSFERGSKGGADIFVAQIDELGFAVTVKNVTAVNTTLSELFPVVSLDDKTLYFAREDAKTTIRDIFVATRAATGDDFGPAEPVRELNTKYEEFTSWVSDDQCRLYFISNRPDDLDGGDAAPSTYRLWMAARAAP